MRYIVGMLRRSLEFALPRGQTTRDSGKDVNIADIASQDEFQITGQVSGQPPCADVHFDGSAKFDVTLL